MPGRGKRARGYMTQPRRRAIRGASRKGRARRVDRHGNVKGYVNAVTLKAHEKRVVFETMGLGRNDATTNDWNEHKLMLNNMNDPFMAESSIAQSTAARHPMYHDTAIAAGFTEAEVEWAEVTIDIVPNIGTNDNTAPVYFALVVEIGDLSTTIPTARGELLDIIQNSKTRKGYDRVALWKVTGPLEHQGPFRIQRRVNMKALWRWYKRKHATDPLTDPYSATNYENWNRNFATRHAISDTSHSASAPKLPVYLKLWYGSERVNGSGADLVEGDYSFTTTIRQGVRITTKTTDLVDAADNHS